MSNLIIRRAITLPFRALGVNGEDYNELFFPRRHTLVFSGVGSERRTDEDWMTILSHSNVIMPNRTNQDVLLLERGAYGDGVDIVQLREAQQVMNLAFTLQGKDRIEYERARDRFAYITSGDLASYGFDTPLEPPDPEQKPSLWTYTYIGQDGIKRHIDFFPRSVGEDGDNNGLQLQSTLGCLVPDPRFYGDDLIDEFEERPTLSSVTYPYIGSARSGFRIEIDNIDATEDPLRIRAVALTQIVGPQSFTHLFQHEDLAFGSWDIPLASITPANPLVFDSELRLWGQEPFDVTTDFSLTVFPNIDWRIMQILPKCSFQVEIVSKTPGVINDFTGRVIYKNRWRGI